MWEAEEEACYLRKFSIGDIIAACNVSVGKAKIVAAFLADPEGQFERHRYMRGWTERESALNLGVHLTGDALHFFERLPELTKENYEKATEALNKRFGRLLTPEALRAQFANLTQEGDESIQQYAEGTKSSNRCF